MRHFLFSFIVFFPSLCFGQNLVIFDTTEDNAPPPVINVLGADDSYAFGEMISLQIDPTLKLNGDWQAKYEWAIFDQGKLKTKGVMPWPDGTRVFFATGLPRQGEFSKTFTVYVTASFQHLQKSKLKVVDGSGNPLAGAKIVTEDGKTIEGTVVTSSDVVQATPFIKEITVGTVAPDPPLPNPQPGPGPAPAPTPTFETGRYNLAKIAYDTAMSNVPANSRRVALKLADSFSASAFKITGSADGIIKPDPKYNTIENVFVQIKAANLAIFTENGVDKSEWSKWSSTIEQSLYDFYINGNLRTVADLADALLEISHGLSQVK